jgi:hypothetical protein
MVLRAEKQRSSIPKTAGSWRQWRWCYDGEAARRRDAIYGGQRHGEHAKLSGAEADSSQSKVRLVHVLGKKRLLPRRAHLSARKGVGPAQQRGKESDLDSSWGVSRT